jgi:putative transposase
VKQLVFGKARFNRISIPDQLRDTAHWPAVDHTALSEEERAAYLKRCRALQAFLEEPHTPLAAILRETGVARSALYRLLDRCWERHDDGRIFGFRALVPYARLKEYERNRPVDAQWDRQGGSSGAFTQLLRDYPSLKKLLDKFAKQRNSPIRMAREVRKPLREVHGVFLDACRAAKISANEYPFTEKRLGYRSMQSYFKKFSEKSFGEGVTNAGGLRAGAAVSARDQAPAATRAFEVVEFDGHKIDLRLTVKIIDPLGFETRLELHRVWILVLLDVFTRSVIGYSLALGKEYNKDDVAAALQSAMTPFVPKTYQIPTLSIRAGGGFPSATVPETAYACWDWFRIDGAKAHLATDTLSRLNQIIGCWTDNGPPAEPDARPFIERFFDLIAAHFAHRFPGTTGSNAQSIERVLSDPGSDISLLVELSELEEMIEVLLANYNGETHGGIGPRSPLEAMAYSVAKYPGYLRRLPRFMTTNLCLLQEARVVTIKGGLKTGVRPHINFSNARYTNEILSANPALIGKKLRIYYDVRDIRSLKAFFEDGAELGILNAARPWNLTPHSLRVRREIFRLIAEGKLQIREGDNPIEAWEKYKWSQARTNKRAANALAKAKSQGNLPSANKNVDPAASVAPEVVNQASDLPNPGATIAPESIVHEPAPQPKILKIRRTITF